METLPSKVRRLINYHLPVLLSWFSAYLMDLVVKQQADHHLVKFNQTFDFSRLVELYADYRPKSTRGSGIDHTTEQLARAVYIKYHYVYSYRQTEESIKNNLLVRWFVGYGLHQNTPDHSTIHNFESWIREHHPDSFHLELMHQIDARLPEDQKTAQIGDTFATNAHAQVKFLPDLLRDTCQKILHHVLLHDEPLHKQLCAKVDKEALFGQEGEKLTPFLSEKQFKERAEVVGLASFAFLSLLRTNWHWLAHFRQVDRQQLLEILAILEKILADDFEIERIGGQVAALHLRAHEKKGTYRVRSITDPDATFRVHNDKINFGYNVNVLGTTNFIREIHVATGSTPDALPIPVILQNHHHHYGFYPDKIIYDRAAGTGKYVHQVTQVSNGQTQLSVKLIDYDQRTERFKPTDFDLSADGLSLTCPQGVTTTRKYRHGKGDGYTYRFIAPMCQECPVKTLIRCRGKPDIPTTPRNTFISDYSAPRQKALAYSKTPAFKEDMTLRNQVERLIAGLVLHSGARNARVRRIGKVQFQLTMNAMAYNAKRFINILAQQKTAPQAA